MWRKFHDYCKVVEDRGWNSKDDTCSHEVRALSQTSCENQLVVDALMESIDGNGKVVRLPLEKK